MRKNRSRSNSSRLIDGANTPPDLGTLHNFSAALDAAELDERDRPGVAWRCQTTQLGKRALVIRSRRMCYPGHRLATAIHLVDDQPMPLCGTVRTCDYATDGRYQITLQLNHTPEGFDAQAWAATLHAGPRQLRTRLAAD